MKDVIGGRVSPRRQPWDEGSTFSTISEEDFRLDWSWPAEKIRRYITMSPGNCFTSVGEVRLYLSKAELSRSESSASPGTVLKIGRVRSQIAAGDGAVWVSRGRVERGFERPLADIFQELKVRPGSVLV
jgi:methionyl-tRNA formyltransferase